MKTNLTPESLSNIVLKGCIFLKFCDVFSSGVDRWCSWFDAFEAQRQPLQHENEGGHDLQASEEFQYCPSRATYQ